MYIFTEYVFKKSRKKKNKENNEIATTKNLNEKTNSNNIKRHYLKMLFYCKCLLLYTKTIYDTLYNLYIIMSVVEKKTSIIKNLKTCFGFDRFSGYS